MKLLGFLLLVAGWVIVLTAVALLSARTSLGVFVLAGIGVEAMGLAFIGQSSPLPRETQE
jgi:hypothetical protein